MGLGVSWKLHRKWSQGPGPQERTPAAGEQDEQAGPRGLLRGGSGQQGREAAARGATAQDSGLKGGGWAGTEAEAHGGHGLPA